MKTPLRRYTFENRRIREWVESHVKGRVLNLFAGKTKLDCDEIRNDISLDMPAHFHMDALKFCWWWATQRSTNDLFGTVLLDPPYSYRKSMEMYGGKIMSPFNALKNEIPKILKPGGLVITFGYHSNSMGAKRGFIQEHLLVMSHGGAIHDTLAVIERKTDED
jgi:23S rRNA G2069 N7-methylase RlmK/C1962 C5-methylase RlmI